MLLLLVLFTSTIDVNELPSVNAPKPAPLKEPYLMSGNWPEVRPIPVKLIVTVETDVSAPLTLMIGAVGLPNELASRFSVEPALSVNEGMFNEVPGPATFTPNAAPVARL